MKGYQQWVLEFAAQASDMGCGLVPGLDSMEAESDAEQLLDYTMLRLRLADGIPMHDLEERFGRSAAQAVEATLLSGNLSSAGFAHESQTNNQRHVRLSDPEGFLMSNNCIATLFAALPDQSSIQKERTQVAVSH